MHALSIFFSCFIFKKLIYNSKLPEIYIDNGLTPHTHTGSFRGYLSCNKIGIDNIKTHVLYSVFGVDTKLHM